MVGRKEERDEKKRKRRITETDCKRTDRTADRQEVDGSMDGAHRRYILTDERTQSAVDLIPTLTDSLAGVGGRRRRTTTRRKERKKGAKRRGGVEREKNSDVWVFTPLI